jgi:glycosyltransferase involved in cell wall biosynthesis
MKNNLISIIIPTYNRATDLKRALDSVISQGYKNWEAVVVDNHSSDNTDEIIESYHDSRISLFKIHNNGVIAASRNLGISKAKGEFIAFLDSDDWWAPSKLEVALEFLLKGADLVYHSMFIVKKQEQTAFSKKTRVRALKSNAFADLLQQGNTINNSSVVLRKSILEAIGTISEKEELIAIEDYDLWLRFSQITNKMVLIPETLGYYWMGGGNTSNPHLVIKTITSIKNKYAQQLSEQNLNNQYTWFNYALSKAFIELKNYSKARDSISNIQWAGGQISFYLKSRVLLLKTYL